VFLAAFFAYVWLGVEPALQDQNPALLFGAGWAFLKPFAGRVGGLLDYSAAGLAQLNYSNWPAALALTTLGGLIAFATYRVLRGLAVCHAEVALFVPSLLLLALCDRYDGSAAALGLGQLLGTCAALAYGALPLEAAWSRLMSGGLLWGVVFWVGGLWPCLLGAVLAGLFEGSRRRGKLPAIAVIATGIAWPILWFGAHGQLLPKLLFPWPQGTSLVLALALYLAAPLAALGLNLVPQSAEPTRPPAHGRHGAAANKGRPAWTHRLAARGQLAWVVLGLGAGAVGLAHDPARKCVREIDYYSSRQDYQKVLAAAKGVRNLAPSSEIRVHRALYHTGQLGEDLFSFSNQTSWTVFPGLSLGLESCRPQSATLLELGQVNVAEHCAHEALEHEGERPELLWLLARINILNDRPKAAAVFLNVLRKMPGQGDRAAAWLERLRVDPRFSEDPELAGIRSLMVRTDLPHTDLPTEPLLRQCLHSNRTNRMAFEYLMAHCLLSREPEKVVNELPRLDELGYTSIPRHYEEAVLLYQQIKGGITVDLHGRRVRPETQTAFKGFAEAINGRVHETETGRRELSRRFGDTFWFYYLLTKTTETSSSATKRME
jgi:hypothetical protein